MIVVLVSIALTLVACSRSRSPEPVPVIDVRANGADPHTPLPDNVVVLRSEGPSEVRKPPPQALVDQVRSIVPNSRESTVWFAGLEDGRILEPHCNHGGVEEGCGEEAGFAGEALDLLGLGGVDEAITDHRAAVVFDKSVVSHGRVTLFNESQPFELPAVIARTGRTWIGLPTIWIPNLRPAKSGVVPLPFAVVVASPEPLTDGQYADLDALEQNLQRLTDPGALSDTPGCGPAPPGSVPPPNTPTTASSPAEAPSTTAPSTTAPSTTAPSTTMPSGRAPGGPLDACDGSVALDGLTNGYTEIYTARSVPR